jgi:TonB-linked SusC/RagA family outer membrane protein
MHMKNDLKLKCQPPAIFFRYLLVGFLILVAPTFVQAQNRTISGQVSDVNKVGIPGVTVLVKGTKSSSVTDFDGKYQIKASNENPVLVFSYMGFETKEVVAGNKTQVNTTLKESTSQLNEVVIVGYGTQKKANLTGSVSTVSSKAIEDRPVTSLAAALQGTAAGLNVTRTTGQPGAENMAIQIRGASSANGSVNPLLLIDGVATELFNLQTINPLDVESMTILKDGAAAAIYGAQAAGGVILVTTKMGKKGKAKFDFSTQIAGQEAINVPDRMPLLEEANFSNLARANAGQGPEYSATDLENIKNGVEYIPHPTNPNQYVYYNQKNIADQVLRKNSFIKTNNLTASGGTEKTSYLFSLGYLDQEGVFKVGPDHFNRFNLRLNMAAELTKHLSFDTRISYADHKRDMPSLGANDYGLFQSLYQTRTRFPIFTPEGNLSDAGNYAYAHLTEGGYEKREINDLDGNFSLTAKNFAKGLTLKAIYGRKLRSNDTDLFKRTVPLWGKYTPTQFLNNPNSYTLTQEALERENFQFLTNYDLTIAEKHKFNFMVGYQWEDYRRSSVSSGASALRSNDLPTLNLGDPITKTNSQSIITYANQSYFGRFNYNYDGKYLLEGTLRSDESSRLAPDLRTKIFPSASLGWNAHKEGWFKNSLPFVSELKPRVSWGQLGSAQGDNIGYYDYLNLLSMGTNLVMGSPEERATFFVQNTVPSSQLSWETVETFNYGFDLGLFNNKLTTTFDYYTKYNRNMLTPLQLPATFGVGTPKINNGVLKSWGWELSFNYRNKIGKDFKYGLGFNFSDNNNELISYAGRSVVGVGSNGIIEGYPLNTIWGYKTASGYITTPEQLAAAPFFNSRTGIGDIAYIDQNGDKKINPGKGSAQDPGDLVNLGTDQQRYLFGITAEADWKNLDFSIFFQGVGQRSFLPNTEMIMPLAQSWFSPMAHHRDYWTPENPNAAFPRPFLGGTHNYVASDRWVLNGAYIRLKNIQLGYTLPQELLKKIEISRLRLYISAQDIFTFTKLGVFESVFDPEQKDSVRADYPLFASVSFGLNLSF